MAKGIWVWVSQIALMGIVLGCLFGLTLSGCKKAPDQGRVPNRRTETDAIVEPTAGSDVGGQTTGGTETGGTNVSGGSGGHESFFATAGSSGNPMDSSGGASGMEAQSSAGASGENVVSVVEGVLNEGGFPVEGGEGGFLPTGGSNGKEVWIKPQELCDGIDNDGDAQVDEGFADTDKDSIADCIDQEDCDGMDNNGDGQTDEGFPDEDGIGLADCHDLDGDGFTEEEGDCHDENPTVHPGGIERWYDELDSDCNGKVEPDICVNNPPPQDLSGRFAGIQNQCALDAAVRAYGICEHNCESNTEFSFEVLNLGKQWITQVEVTLYGVRASGKYEALQQKTVSRIAPFHSSGGLRFQNLSSNNLKPFTKLEVSIEPLSVEAAEGQNPIIECNQENNRAQFSLSGLSCGEDTPTCEDGAPGYEVAQNPDCEYRPSPFGGHFDPILKWGEDFVEGRLEGNSIVSAVVGNLTDDNGDGKIDDHDIPDIVSTMYGSIGNSPFRNYLFVVSGDTGEEHWRLENQTSYDSGVAIADVDRDGVPEIFAHQRRIFPGENVTTTKLVAFDHEGNFLWYCPHPGDRFKYFPAPSVIDIDEDGYSEIISQNHICSHRGEHLLTTDLSHRLTPIALDIDLDGQKELISGRGVSRVNIQSGTNETLWENPYGYAAVANLNEDPFGEIVISHVEGLTLYSQEGEVLWHHPFFDEESDQISPPIISNFDEDEAPEIAVLLGFDFVIVDGDGTILDRYDPEVDQEEKLTGASAFDLNAVAPSEISASEMGRTWIYYGASDFEPYVFRRPTDGLGIFSEYPIFVDVDGDKKVEFVVPAHNQDRDRGLAISVYESRNDDWVTSRPVWNQHAYHITNINDDLTVPRHQVPHWLEGENTFRAGAFAKEGPFAAPNLVPVLAGACDNTCPSERIVFHIENRGAIQVGPGTPWAVFVDTVNVEAGGEAQEPIANGEHNAFIPAGSATDSIAVDIDAALLENAVRLRLVVDNVTGADGIERPRGKHSECFEDDNTLLIPLRCTEVDLCQNPPGQGAGGSENAGGDMGGAAGSGGSENAGGREEEPIDVCDGWDNDCDGAIDEGFGDEAAFEEGATCSSGIGLCRVEGVPSCEEGILRCSAIAKTPVAERCDGFDNDCDGIVDENSINVGFSCTVGMGECARTAPTVCADGEIKCPEPGEPEVEICDGLDNDCDGFVDEPEDDEADCNENGTADVCDLTFGEPDCNENSIPDVCDLASGTSEDCNQNNSPDECADDQEICLADAESPTLSLWVSHGQAELGELIQIVVDAEDNISRVELTVAAEEQALELDDLGQTFIMFAEPGMKTILARATDYAGNEAVQEHVVEVVEPAVNGLPGIIIEDFTEDGLLQRPVWVRGTIEDVDLVYWQATVAPRDNEDEAAIIQIGEGETAIRNQEIGFINVPSFEPGRYVLEVFAEDELGASRTVRKGFLIAPCEGEPERCDGLDNDCDGTSDEDFPDVGQACEVGQGMCQRQGVIQCFVDGEARCNVIAGEPEPERCDDLDHDCDGETHNGFDVGKLCNVGIGICAVSGITTCDPSGEFVACISDENREDDCDIAAIRGRNGINRAPEFLSQPPIEGEEGVPYRYTPEVDDLDGDLLSFTLLEAPPGMRVSQENGAVFWVPGEQDAGEHDVVLEVTDEAGESAEQSWRIDVAEQNQAPAITSTPQNVVALNMLWQYAPEAEDPDGDELSWSLLEGPEGMAFDENGVLTWLVDQNEPAMAEIPIVEIQAEDPSGETATQRFRLVMSDDSDDRPPFVEITLPEDEAEVSGIVEVWGTAEDDTLAEYSLFACSVEDPLNCRTFERSTFPVEGGRLGVLNTQIMEPGLWNVILRAVDAQGLTSETSIKVDVLVGTQVGIMRIQLTDLFAQQLPFMVRIERHYDSSVVSDGDFGIGWRLVTDLDDTEGLDAGVVLPDERISRGWSVRFRFLQGTLEGEPRPVLFKLPDGRQYEMWFSPTMGGCVAGGCQLFERWLGPNGASLVTRDRRGDTYGDDLFIMNGDDTLTRFFDPGIEYEPTQFELTTELGEVYRFELEDDDLVEGRRGELVSYLDEEGEEHAWQTPPSLGELVEIARNARGHIVRIRDRNFGDEVRYRYSRDSNLVSVEFVGGEYHGERQSFSYDDMHRMTAYEVPGQRMNDVVYDAYGRIRFMTDGAGSVTETIHEDYAKTMVTPSGDRVRLEHDDFGNVTSTTDVFGNMTRFEYDEDGNEIRRILPRGGAINREFDEKGEVLSETDPAGVRKGVAFDEEDRLTRFSFGGDDFFEIEYGDDNLIRIFGPNGEMLEEFAYDDDGNLLFDRDGRGREEHHTYDENNRAVRSDGSDDRSLQHAYDARGLTVTSTEEDTGESFTTRYDPTGNMRELTLSTGERFQYEWDARGMPTKLSDPDGRIFNLRTNGQGKLSRLEINGQPVTQMRYDANGFVASTLNAEGHVVRYERDAMGRVIAAHGAHGTERREYDADGNLTARVLPTGERLEMAHDLAGRVIEVRLGGEDGSEVAGSVAYDEAGRTSRVTDQLGRSRTMQYDGYGNMVGQSVPGLGSASYERDTRTFSIDQEFDHPVISSVTATGAEWQFEYDENGELISVVDPQGLETEYTRGLDGEVTQVTLPDGAEWRFEQDENRHAVIWPSGSVERTEYMDDGSTVQQFADGTRVVSFWEGEEQVRALSNGTELRTLNVRGKPRRSQSPDATMTYAYDAYGKLVRARGEDGAEVRYTRDASGRVVEMTLRVPSGEIFRTTYRYSGGLLTRMTDPDGGVWEYTYDAVGRIQSIVRPNGTRTEYTFGDLDRPALIEHVDAEGAVIHFERFFFDEAGRIVRMESPNRNDSYTYHPMGWLESEEEDRGETTTWQYDVVGNMIQKTHVVPGEEDAVEIRRHDETGAVTEINEQEVLVNQRGFRSQHGETTYTYNDLGWLSQVQKDNREIQYGYDASGMLVSRAETNVAENEEAVGEEQEQSTRCLMAPTPFNHRAFCLVAYDDENASAYLFDPMGVAGRHGGDGLRYTHRGLHSSIMKLTDGEGAVCAEYQYDAWGEARPLALEQEQETFRYGYAGEQTDPTTGHIYLRARWYDPTTGTFLTPDSAPAPLSDPRNLHRYNYIPGGAPLNYIDPDGEFALVELVSVQAITRYLRTAKIAIQNCIKKKGKNKIVRSVVESLALRIVREIFDPLKLAMGLAGIFGTENIFDQESSRGRGGAGNRQGAWFEYLLGKKFCELMKHVGEGFSGIRFRIPISRCGKEEANPVSCRNFDESFGNPNTSQPREISVDSPSGSGAEVDILLRDFFPIEQKLGHFYKARQIWMYCRYASIKGGYITAILNGKWPPYLARNTGININHGNQTRFNFKKYLSRTAKGCFYCWRNSRCQKKANLGSLLLSISYKRDENVLKKRIKIFAPKLKGICK